MSVHSPNLLHLSAHLTALQALRYTPAGVPALDIELSHESTQNEAGQARQTRLNLRAIAFGMVAEQLAKQPLGQSLHLQGFLAAGKNGKGLIFHIQSFDI
jgi:primosomal replication protein N